MCRGFLISILLTMVAVATPRAAEGAEISAEKRELIRKVMDLGRYYEIGASELVQQAVAAAKRAGKKPDEATVTEGIRRAARDEQTRSMIGESYVPLFDPLSEDELRALVRFYESDLGARFAEVNLRVLTSGRGGLAQHFEALKNAKSGAKGKRTVADMRAIVVAVMAYSIDENAYPTGITVEDLRDELEPTYIRSLPTRDAWGNPYGWVLSRSSFRIISGGPDGTIEPENRRIGSERKGDDVVVEDGEFLE